MYRKIIVFSLSFLLLCSISYAGNLAKAGFIEKDKKIILGTYNGSISILNLKGKVVKKFTLPGELKAISPDQNILAIERFGKISLYNLKGEILGKIETPFSMRINKISFTPDSQHIIAGTQKGRIIIYDFKGKEIQIFTGHTSSINSISTAKDSIASTAYGEKTIFIWSIKNKNTTTISGFKMAPNIAVLSSKGKKIISSGNDKILYCHNTKGKLLWKSKYLGNMFLAVELAFGYKGKKIYAGGMDGEVKIWNKKGKLIKSIKTHKEGFQELKISKKGKIWFTRSSDELIIWKKYKKIKTVK